MNARQSAWLWILLSLSLTSWAAFGFLLQAGTRPGIWAPMLLGLGAAAVVFAIASAFAARGKQMRKIAVGASLGAGALIYGVFQAADIVSGRAKEAAETRAQVAFEKHRRDLWDQLERLLDAIRAGDAATVRSLGETLRRRIGDPVESDLVADVVYPFYQEQVRQDDAKILDGLLALHWRLESEYTPIPPVDPAVETGNAAYLLKLANDPETVSSLGLGLAAHLTREGLKAAVKLERRGFTWIWSSPASGPYKNWGALRFLGRQAGLHCGELDSDGDATGEASALIAHLKAKGARVDGALDALLVVNHAFTEPTGELPAACVTWIEAFLAAGDRSTSPDIRERLESWSREGDVNSRKLSLLKKATSP